MTKKIVKLTAWEHVKVAHDNLLIAYSMIDPTNGYAETITRALRSSALAMGQMPVTFSNVNKKKIQEKKK